MRAFLAWLQRLLDQWIDPDPNRRAARRQAREQARVAEERRLARDRNRWT